ncbi:hypothetical protein [Roseomonas fluvialis]|nr:hypothetical protein [Roseomonas fluvialis]
MTDSTRATAILARSLADIAEGGLAHRMRLEQAARVIVAARRASHLAAAGALALPATDPAVQAVTEIARHWDDTAVTALEYAEGLPVAALERLLRAAPSWAAAFAPGSWRQAA